jgi:hypothetical protein
LGIIEFPVSNSSATSLRGFDVVRKNFPLFPLFYVKTLQLYGKSVNLCKGKKVMQGEGTEKVENDEVLQKIKRLLH